MKKFNINLSPLKKAYWMLPFSNDKKRSILNSIRSKGIVGSLKKTKVNINEYKEYSDSILKSSRYRSEYYEDDLINHNDVIIKCKHPKLIAYYLTQFHPTKQNDQWWGKGVTEWNNVFRGVPQFIGHEQPRLPGELGAYDLRLKENISRQIELAKKSGIYGFSFYYYWFSGERLLEKPLDLFFDNKDLDFNYMLCWANESWTKRFDGTSQEILMKHHTEYEKNINFINDIQKYLRDERYIKIDGAPVIQIYRPNNCEKIEKLISYWREEAVKLGIERVHFMAVSFGDNINTDLISKGFDSINDFQPGSLMSQDNHKNINNTLSIINKEFVGQVYDYENISQSSKYRDAVYPAVMPSWDNTARRVDSGLIFLGSTPKLYGCWLKSACDFSVNDNKLNNNFVFINAWNEWGEGAYLEPDKNYGYAYLNETRRVMDKFINE